MPKVQGSYQGITMQPQFPTYQTAGMLQPAPQAPVNPSTPPPAPPPQVASNPPTPTPTPPVVPPVTNPQTPIIPPVTSTSEVPLERQRLVDAVLKFNTFEV